ncbi:SpoIIE family protein phosphatase [Salinibacillus xinjiangensis]|uniref:SpoIIE family protein phosphatase n=1 Tax=Salinibacillus xinjiangensis TaxID=1229268 RepID=UPI00129B9808|nr:SpoIIE family protein phosphatase [Salinibacillus xinjiangensis]
MNGKENQIEVSVFQQPKIGNKCNGDYFFYKETETQFISVLADGLGSGADANESSSAAIHIIKDHHTEPMEKLIKLCNNQLIHKRGVVLGIIKMDLVNKTFELTSIGNVGIAILKPNGEKKRNIPTPGYLPSYGHSFKVKRGELEPGHVFLMYSDGVYERSLLKHVTEKQDMFVITDRYAKRERENIADDTTLLAMRYG